MSEGNSKGSAQKAKKGQDNGGQRPKKKSGPSARSKIAHRITDVCNLGRLCIGTAGGVLFNCTDKRWYIWDGARFRVDTKGNINEITMAVMQGIYDEAEGRSSPEEREILIDWARRSEMHDRLKACIKLAETDSNFTVCRDELDADPWLLGAQNGTIDLRTGELKEPKRSDKITKSVGYNYDPDAKCPTWNSFLDVVIEGNEQKLDYLQRAAGYSLTGHTTEDCFFLLLGIGKNGKSKFIDGMSFALGEYAEAASTSTFLAKGANATGHIPNDLAALTRARMVFTSEPNKGSRFDENVIKQLTGQDIVKARFLFKEFFSYMPNFKIWISANNTPEIRDLTQSIWERVKVIEFNRYLKPEERDKSLRRKLEREKSGILRWAIEGCLKWQTFGLDEPDDISTAVKNYQYAENSIARFLGECCEEGDAAKVEVSGFYRHYSDWSKSQNEKPEKKSDVTAYLQARGFRTMKVEGQNFYIGVQIRLTFSEMNRNITNW